MGARERPSLGRETRRARDVKVAIANRADGTRRDLTFEIRARRLDTILPTIGSRFVFHAGERFSVVISAEIRTGPDVLLTCFEIKYARILYAGRLYFRRTRRNFVGPRIKPKDPLPVPEMK